jgi:hypothetical protein
MTRWRLEPDRRVSARVRRSVRIATSLESFSRPIAFRLNVKEAVARLENSAHIARRTNRHCATLVDLDQWMPASDMKQ